MIRVYLVGAGCGVDTLTLRGKFLLQNCDCVVYDSLLDENILENCRKDCIKIFVGKRSGRHNKSQEEINEILKECAKKYPLTVRLKGGDPFVFGRGGEEMLYLSESGVECASVPGVSSAIAAAEEAGIPVTHRGMASGFCVVTAHTADGAEKDCMDFSFLAKCGYTLVFLMGKGAAGKIAAGLCGGGMAQDTPAAVLSCAGTPQFIGRRCTLAQLKSAADSLPAPQTIVVGKVCALHLQTLRLDSFVAVTGTRTHVDRVSQALALKGIAARDCSYSEVIALPCDEFFEKQAQFAWLVFTSANAVDAFFSAMRKKRTDIRLLLGKKFAVIGKYTAEKLAEYGFYADLMPQEHSVHGLARALREAGVQKEQAAALRNKIAGGELCGAATQFDVYETRTDAEKLRRAFEISRECGYITFGSAGGARAFLEKYALGKTVPVCIGKETANAVRSFGFCPLVSEDASAEKLAEAIEADLSKKREDPPRKTDADRAESDGKEKDAKEDE